MVDLTARALDTVTGLTASLVAPFTVNPAGPVPSGPPGNWRLVWSDEFDGTAIDTSKWYVSDGGEVRNATPCYASNVSVSGGQLHLKCLNVNSGCEIHSSGALTGRTDPPNGYRLPLGGVYEGRVAFQGDGTHYYGWPAFWTYNGHTGEVDIAEVNGWSGGDTTKLTINYHYGSNQNNAIPSGYWGNGVFHTFTLYRGATTNTIWWDGVQKWSFPMSDDGSALGLIINNSKSANGTNLYPNTMLVDYVRAWVPA